MIFIVFTSILCVPLFFIIETDSPYMSPVPQTRNDPSTVPRGIAAIAKVKGLTTEEVADIVMKNFYRLFGDSST